MVFNIHAGHNPAGKIACGAVGYLNESAENRKIKNYLILILRSMGHTVYDCTVDDGKSQGDLLTRIVKKCNSHKVDLDVSIHLNAGGGSGVECYCYDEASVAAVASATLICREISDALVIPDRGVKFNRSLYVLKHTEAQAVLIECCFVDSTLDAERFDAEKTARAIAYALTGQPEIIDPSPSYVQTDTEATATGAETAQGGKDLLYRVQVGAFHDIDYAKMLVENLGGKGIKACITRA